MLLAVAVSDTPHHYAVHRGDAVPADKVSSVAVDKVKPKLASGEWGGAAIALSVDAVICLVGLNSASTDGRADSGHAHDPRTLEMSSVGGLRFGRVSDAAPTTKTTY